MFGNLTRRRPHSSSKKAMHSMRKVFIVIFLTLSLVSTIVPSTVVQARSPYGFSSGEGLRQGEWIVSPNNFYILLFQFDSNLVLYDNASPLGRGLSLGRVLWASNTQSSGAVRATLQFDGNFVLYKADNKPVWASGTSGGSSRLQLQDDRNLVIYQQNGPALWATNTGMPSAAHTLQVCRRGDCLIAVAGTDWISMRYNGNISNEDVFQWRWAEYGGQEQQVETPDNTYIRYKLQPHTTYIIKAQIYDSPGFLETTVGGKVGWLEGLIMTTN